MERRAYGSTGEELSILGFGGIMVSGAEASAARALVVTAIDHGINYFDVAPTYGNAQQMLGPALQPDRDQVFLSCKTTQRSRDGAREELEESLRLLKTDHVDLYQLHAVNTDEDIDTVLGAEGALNLFLEAREQGKTRYLGFSSHSSEAALRLMNEVDVFDSILFPVNFTNWLAADFGPAVVARAQEKGLARLALKALARGKLPAGAERKWTKCWYEPIEDPDLARLALRFTLSQPITAALPPGEPAFFEDAIAVADSWAPLTEEEMARLREAAHSTEPIFELAAA